MSKLTIQKVKASEIELKEKVVNIRRVTKVTKGGRTFTFSATVVVGNGEGVVGEGQGKAREVQEAIKKAIDDAKKNLVVVPVFRGTIPHVQFGKFGAAKASCGGVVGKSLPFGRHLFGNDSIGNRWVAVDSV